MAPKYMTTPRWDVDDFTVGELLDSLDLPEDPTPDEVKSAAQAVIAKTRREGKVEEARFFEDAVPKILHHLGAGDMLSNWFDHEYPQQDDKSQAAKATSRDQKVQVFPGSDPVMNRERLGVSQTYEVPVMQGTINPSQRNTMSRMVFVDSAHKPGLGRTGELNTDFTMDLSEPLTNVLRMRLHSVSIPKTWYTFDPSVGNTCFSAGSVGGAAQSFVVPSGNHDLASVARILTNLLQSFSVTVSASPATGRLTFSSAGQSETVLTFYGRFGLPSEEQSGCGASGCKTAYANQNLGWTLGFRDLQTVAAVATGGSVGPALPTHTNNPALPFTVTLPPGSSVEARAPLDTYGPKTFFLALDEFTQNLVNQAVVTMSGAQSKLPVPDYVPSGHHEEGGRVAKTYPRKLTQAQIYTANEIISDREAPSLQLAPITTGNVLATIPVVGAGRAPSVTYGGDGTTPQAFSYPNNEPMTLYGPDLQANERVYFGPVDIERVRVRLIDDKGNTVNLNGVDWSFTLSIEQLYQY
jgi:hypothetical protein